MGLDSSQQLVLAQYGSSCHPPPPPPHTHHTHTHTFTHGSKYTPGLGLIVWSLTSGPSSQLLSVLYRWLHLQVDEEDNSNNSSNTVSAQLVERHGGPTEGPAQRHPHRGALNSDQPRPCTGEHEFSAQLKHIIVQVLSQFIKVKCEVHIIRRPFLIPCMTDIQTTQK